MAEFFSLEGSETAKIFFTAAELIDLNPESHHGLWRAEQTPGLLEAYRRARRERADDPARDLSSGRRHRADMISHEAEEGGLVISGEIEVTVGDRVGLLKTGDGYLFDSRLPHRFRNLGPEDCVIVSACTPPSF